MRVLIIEDSSVVRARLVELLPAAGVTATDEAADAAAARSAIISHPPDVAVVDLQLPDGSGLDLIPLIKAVRQTALVIVLTNHTLPQYRLQCLAAGADHYFDKTEEFDLATAAIARHVSRTKQA